GQLRTPASAAVFHFMDARAVAVIPARYQSSRLPGKALALIGGRPMICHVAERTRRARGLGRVIVATDDPRIRDAVLPTGVEVAADVDGRALYFSRSAIPHDRDGARSAGEPFGLRHVGMYAFRRDVLLRLAALRPSPLERREQLEQLRALEHGVAIGLVEWQQAEPLIEVDTQADLERARAMVDGGGR